jgi:hypothetical protein
LEELPECLRAAANWASNSVALRKNIEGSPANTVADVETQAKLLAEAEEKTARLRYAADLLLSVEFQPGNDKDGLHNDMAIQAGYYVEKGSLEEFQAVARKASKKADGSTQSRWQLDLTLRKRRVGGPASDDLAFLARFFRWRFPSRRVPSALDAASAPCRRRRFFPDPRRPRPEHQAGQTRPVDNPIHA